MSPTLDQVIDMKEANLINLDGSHTSNMFSDKMLPPIYNTGNPNALIVNISSRPSRRLEAADGYSRSSHFASCLSFCLPLSASIEKAAFIAHRTCSF